MQGLYITSLADNHRHLIYEDAQGNITLFEENGHVHPIIKKEAVAPSVDQFGTPIEGSPESYIIGETEGHTHQFQAIPEEKKKEGVEGSEEEQVAKVLDLYRKGLDNEMDFRRRAQIARNFNIGGDRQWDKEDLSRLKEQKRAHISTNEISSILNALSGQQRQNRTDFKAYPTEVGTTIQADIVTAILKAISYQNSFGLTESKVFEDALETGRGVLSVGIDHTESVYGCITLKRRHFKDVIFGPHEDELIRDLPYEIVQEWVSIDQLESEYPQHKGEFDKKVNISVSDSVFDREAEVNEGDAPGIAASEFYDHRTRKRRVLKLLLKRYKTINVLFRQEDSVDDFILSLENAPSYVIPMVRAAKDADGKRFFKIIRRPSSYMEVIFSTGTLFLESYISSVPIFTEIPLYGKKLDGYVKGKTEDLIPQQRQINKNHSLGMDRMSYAKPAHWVYDDTTFSTPEQERAFIANANIPGSLIKVASMTNKPMLEVDSTTPIDTINMQNLASTKMEKIAGVNPELLGGESNARTGVAITRRIRQGLVPNDYLFDNLSYWKQLVGNTILQFIQEFLPVEEVFRLLKRQHNKMPVILGEKPLDKYQDEEIKSILSDMDFTKYDIVISETASTPTKALDLMTSYSDLVQSGALPALPEVGLDILSKTGLLDPATTEQYKQAYAAQQQQQVAMQQEKNRTELLKSGVGVTPQPQQ